MTYAELLEDLKAYIAGDAAWQRANPHQLFFVNEMFQHFLEGPAAMSSEDRIAFIKAMCGAGESTRYGHRPQEVAAQEFANLLAQHAKRQFEDGRRNLAEVRKALKGFAQQTLIGQVNGALQNGPITSVDARFFGQWEWCVTLERADAAPAVFLEFGPTAIVENGRAPKPLPNPDYTKVFVTRYDADHEGIDQIVQTGVGLDEVLSGLSGDDARLRDEILAVVKAT